MGRELGPGCEGPEPIDASAMSRASATRPRAIELSLSPTPNRPGYFSAQLGGRCILKASRQPLYDAARVLLGEGLAPETPIATRHAGSPIVATRSTLAEASK